MNILKDTDYDFDYDSNKKKRIECLRALQVIQCSVFSSVHYYNDHYRLTMILIPTQKVH